MHKLAISASLAVALGWSPAVLAEDTYQFEAEFAHARDKSDDATVQITGAVLNYYFAALPAQPKDHPLDESAFVGRATGLSVLLARVAVDLAAFQVGGGSVQLASSPGSAAGVEFTFRQPDNPLYIRANILATDYGKQSQTITLPFPGAPTVSVETETESTAYELAVGGYVAQTTLLALELGQEKMKIKMNPGASQEDAKTNRIGLFGRHLTRLPGGEHVVIEARLEQEKVELPALPSETGRRGSVDVTLYPTRMFGLTVGFSSSSGEGANEDSSMRLGARIYVTPSVSLFADIEQVEYKGNAGSADRINLGAALRF